MIKKANNKKNIEEPVTKCDQSKEVVANCDHPQETSLSQYDIEKMEVSPELVLGMLK